MSREKAPIAQNYRILIAILLFMPLLGCMTGGTAVKPNIKNDFNFDKSKDTGLIIGSASQEGWGVYETNYYFKSLDDEEITGRIKAPYSGLTCCTSDIPENLTQMFAIELPAGKYQMVTWAIHASNGISYYPEEVYPLNFTVATGEAVYLGNFHMELIKGKTRFGIPVLERGDVAINDMFERDKPYLTKKFPSLVGLPIKQSVLDGSHWESLDEQIINGPPGTVLLNNPKPKK